MKTVLIIIVYIQILYSQILVTYTNVNSCTDKNIFDNVQITPQYCEKKATTSRYATCNSTHSIITEYNNLMCSGDISSVSFLKYLTCSNNTGNINGLCEPLNLTIKSVAIVAFYTDTTCKTPSNTVIAYKIGQCLLKSTNPNIYTINTCNTTLSQSLYYDSTCTNSIISKSKIADNTCFNSIFGSNKLIGCNVDYPLQLSNSNIIKFDIKNIIILILSILLLNQ